MSVSAASFLSRRLWAVSLFFLNATATAAPATPVFVQEVREIAFAETLEALGTLRANESVTLSATVTETISALHFNDGERVEAGDVLAEMTNAEEKALLEEARSELEEAQRQYERVNSLRESNVSTQSLLDERLRTYRTAQARVHAVESRLQDLVIVAPFDGVVGLRNVSVGTLVRPGDTITTLDDDSVMKLDMAVPSVYLDVLRPGLGVVATGRGLGDKAFQGEIVSIDSRVDPVTRSVVVRARIPNPKRELKPGLLMTAELQKPPRQALVVAEEAVIQRGDRAQVFVIEENRSPTTVMQREVTLGARRPGIVEITSGLAEGERVVIHGTMKLRGGSEVRVAATATGDDSLQDLLQQAAGNPGAGQAASSASASN